VDEAMARQGALRDRLVTDVPLPERPRLVAGVDVAYSSDAVGGPIAGAVVVLELPDLSVVETAVATGTADFPYVPGLLAFREVPILLSALDRLNVRPDVLVCDGYGIAHPRRFGLACHLVVVTGVPTYGVAKTPFIGSYDEIGETRGAFGDLVADDGDVVGRALRTQSGVKPVFVSPGHLSDLNTVTDLTMALAPRYRLPETTRRADRAARDALFGAP
jgi:deoxyribonuclease V